jgi:anti-sigma-K factor RskA
MVEAHRDEHLDLCAAYALGSLDAEDRLRLEQHLAAGCDACESALQEMSGAVTVLAASAPAVEPPPALRARILRAAREDAADQRSPRDIATAASQRTRTVWMWSGWAAAAACLVLALWGWNAASRLRAALDDQRLRIAQLERDRDDLEERLAVEKRTVGVLTASSARFATLAPTLQGDVRWRGRATLDLRGNAVVAFENLETPDDRDYELWAIRDGKPRSLGLVHADANGAALVHVEVENAASVAAFALSLEPKGGAPTPDAPSGPVVLVGTLGGS